MTGGNPYERLKRDDILSTPLYHIYWTYSSPSEPSWRQKRPRSSRYVLGFLLTDEVAARACETHDLSPEEYKDSHIIRRWVVGELTEKYHLPNRWINSPALVYKDRTHSTLRNVVALVDLRSADPSERGPPSVEMVEQIADELKLEGEAREPRWYLLAE
ncbi:hypothetical protein GLOTRDRAFT_136669 [Gloeophyllum trabeum ATCC 11539]|uniref:Uncharacterized protein n=1 Tax=Gloeophyllum trabeum (strain ATCC 11539 / FP-39264 / Madison 617) TaxID=670483 RepID=S7QEG0_GLOTA|nr:uncharacterized protein GLOTRDRAFT_136669 [Gloeophyllum trabeum ATCC 11539]EPQ57807.1 hypothetical protein GLOTRDRAFT_136669 [Gloeophyllum trabeum ATCC 11539]